MSQQQNEIILRDFHLTQNQDDPYGPGCIIKSFDRCTPQMQLGLIMPSTKVVGQTEDKINDGFDGSMKAIHPYSIEDIYIFKDLNGKVHKLDSIAGTASLIHTLAPGAGTKGVYNTMEFNGYIYYAMEKRLGRLDPATDTFDDNFATFTNGDTEEFHPMVVANDTLYIGDGNLVAQVDRTGVFVADALDIEVDWEITNLIEWNTELLVSTRSVRTNNSFRDYKHSISKVYRWNTWSTSWSNACIVPEPVIYGFVQTGGNLYLLTGGKEIKVYSYGEPFASLFSALPDIDSPGGNSILVSRTGSKISPQAILNANNIGYFGVGGTTPGQRYPSGVYSLEAKQPGMPPTIQRLYVNRADGQSEYPCIKSSYGSGLLFSYSDQFSNPSFDGTGVDMAWIYSNSIGTSVQSYNIITGVTRPARSFTKQFRIEVAMSTMRAGTNMALTVYPNSWQDQSLKSPESLNAVAMTPDYDRGIFYLDQVTMPVASMALKISVFGPSSPVPSSIEEIRITFD